MSSSVVQQRFSSQFSSWQSQAWSRSHIFGVAVMCWCQSRCDAVISPLECLSPTQPGLTRHTHREESLDVWGNKVRGECVRSIQTKSTNELEPRIVDVCGLKLHMTAAAVDLFPGQFAVVNNIYLHSTPNSLSSLCASLLEQASCCFQCFLYLRIRNSCDFVCESFTFGDSASELTLIVFG